MTEVTQVYTQGSRRTDGHTNDGIPGDCWRAALASLLGLELDDVPHFGLYARQRWWFETRRWLQGRGLDLWYVPLDEDDIPDSVMDDGLVLLAGPSPRGPFSHVAVGHPDGTVVWDPHPSRAGLRGIEEAFVLTEPYGYMEERLALTA